MSPERRVATDRQSAELAVIYQIRMLGDAELATVLGIVQAAIPRSVIGDRSSFEDRLVEPLTPPVAVRIAETPATVPFVRRPPSGDWPSLREEADGMTRHEAEKEWLKLIEATESDTDPATSRYSCAR